VVGKARVVVLPVVPDVVPEGTLDCRFWPTALSIALCAIAPHTGITTKIAADRSEGFAPILSSAAKRPAQIQRMG